MLTDKEAIRLLGHQMHFMRSAWISALDTHLRGVNHPGLTDSVRGGIIQNLAVFYMRQRTSGRFRELQQRQIIIMDDVALVCFKTLDEQLHCKGGQPSALADMFYGQQNLPGFPDLTHLVAGAIISDDYSSIVGTYLICPSSQTRNNWELRIGDDNVDLFGQTELPAPDGPLPSWKLKKLPPHHDESTGNVG